MNRKLRRMMERKERREQTVRMTPAEYHLMKQQAMEKATGFTYEQTLPVFLLYLADCYRCKEKGILRFMEWFNAMAAWLEEDPNRLNEVKEEFEEKTEVEIVW